jgi:hypothetical protein
MASLPSDAHRATLEFDQALVAEIPTQMGRLLK